MLKIIGIIVLVIVLLIGVEFSAINSHMVDVNYFIGSNSWPLSLVVVSAFSVGVILAILISMLVFMPLRFRIGRLRRAVSDQENEITSLRKRSGSSVR